MADEWAKAHALKRGGKQSHFDDGVLNQIADPNLDPARRFDQDFARALVARALAKLRDEIPDNGPRALFDALADGLFERPDKGALVVLAQAHGIRANTIAVTLSRWRRRLQHAIRAEIARLVSDPRTIDAEMQALRAALLD